MIVRETDAERLNVLANSAGVQRFLSVDGLSVDLSAFIQNPANIALRCGEAVALFEVAEDDPQVFFGHYLFPRAVRGAAALAAAREMLAEMFTTYGARVILGETPKVLRHARVFSRALGFRPIGESVDDAGFPCVVYRLDHE